MRRSRVELRAYCASDRAKYGENSNVINFWYAVEESDKVTDKLVHVEMLGQEFVLFRDTDG